MKKAPHRAGPFQRRRNSYFDGATFGSWIDTVEVFCLPMTPVIISKPPPMTSTRSAPIRTPARPVPPLLSAIRFSHSLPPEKQPRSARLVPEKIRRHFHRGQNRTPAGGIRGMHKMSHYAGRGATHDYISEPGIFGLRDRGVVDGAESGRDVVAHRLADDEGEGRLSLARGPAQDAAQPEAEQEPAPAGRARGPRAPHPAERSGERAVLSRCRVSLCADRAAAMARASAVLRLRDLALRAFCRVLHGADARHARDALDRRLAHHRVYERDGGVGRLSLRPVISRAVCCARPLHATAGGLEVVGGFHLSPEGSSMPLITR